MSKSRLAIFRRLPHITSAALVAISTLSCSASSKALKDSAPQILVDQFGYRPQDSKVAVVIGPLNESQSYELREVGTEQVIEVITPVKWGNGAIHVQSGERAWWVDFSDVKAPGTYVLVGENGKTRSAEFDIRGDVYRDILVAATKMFFYQRSGFAKEEPFADARWADGAAYVGPAQDTAARFVNDKLNPALERNMGGGWFNGGDTGKTVTYALEPVHQLLSAYEQNQPIWTDDFNIPESGNGIPDLLDEVKFELDWLQRMQDYDGGAFSKVGVIEPEFKNPIPSKDERPRYYGPKCSSSTIAIASMFAHAAWEMQAIPELSDYANDLRARAVAAWNWYQDYPIDTECDTGEIQSKDADMSPQDQLGASISAAIYLFAITEEFQYSDYVAENLSSAQPYSDSVWSRYSPHQGDALLFYTQLPNADSGLKEQILIAFKKQLDNPDAYGSDDTLDPFRSYMPDAQYHWGSNQVKANYGNMNYDPILLGINNNEQADYTERAAGALQYLHGVNPLGIVYLTNMYAYGAETSVNEMHHQWLGQGPFKNALTSKHGPTPGFLIGGPNTLYSGDEALATGPAMKAYMDTNDTTVPAWEMSSPALPYQAAYIKLLSKFVSSD
ncbi:MAG: glycoside hydrolase family 9 protein [Cyanobacteria bacterium P01_F01_bin.13]